ncbi:ankyrin repeat-containing protein, putative [Ricinus communis]|uniref:Ankyrin repeat-containing protein, putative n=1 Tax=Ricinus communis TaxID=3988 RepID=B9RA09_RICCO|nr:ankyrin repeat-containing protein, putative [Ricinus communis]
MDARLLEAAQSGNIVYLHQLLAENPLILLSTALFSSENPLHIASIAGHVDFVKDLLRLKPEFAQELNQDGYSPMHMAATIGHVEIVRELAKVDSRLCRVRGKQKKTPLHLAAIKGRAEVTSVMLMSCPDCIEDVTVRGETAVHQAVKNNQFHAVNVLVDWIRGTNREEMLNVKDELGNTVLHLAAWKKQRQAKLLLGAATIRSGILEVNAKNNSGLTCLDLLLIFPSEAGDAEVIEILRGAGALQAKDISHSPISSFQYVNQITASTSTQITPSTSTASETCQTPHPNNLVNYFKFKKGRDSPSEARSALLVMPQHKIHH